jgi:NADP-dependent 3-hydroxy acid dehydrogenase YdfG
MSFLQLEGLHVFVTGAAGGIGSAIVTEFLGNQLPEPKRRTALM